jgi:hypothetical protein
MVLIRKDELEEYKVYKQQVQDVIGLVSLSKVTM